MGIRFQADVCPTIAFWPALQPNVSPRQWVSGLLPWQQSGWQVMPTIHLDIMLQGKEGEGISPPRLGPQWPVVLNPQLWTLNRACPGHPTPYTGPLSVVHNHSPIWFDTGIEFRLFWDHSRFSSGLQQHSSTSFQIHNSQIWFSALEDVIDRSSGNVCKELPLYTA